MPVQPYMFSDPMPSIPISRARKNPMCGTGPSGNRFMPREYGGNPPSLIPRKIICHIPWASWMVFQKAVGMPVVEPVV